MGNKLVVGCGALGSLMAATWMERKNTVTGTVTCTENIERIKNYTNHQIVVKSDASGLKDCVDNMDTILICVAPSQNTQADILTLSETYVDLNLDLFQLIKKSKNKNTHIIYISTTSVYSRDQGLTTEEGIKSDSLKANVHLNAENIILNSSPNVTVLRLGGLYGMYKSIMPYIRSISGKQMSSSGREIVPLVHLGDVVGAIAFAEKIKLYGTYNVSSNVYEYKDIVSIMCRKNNLPDAKWNSMDNNYSSFIASSEKLVEAGYQFKYNSEKDFC